MPEYDVAVVGGGTIGVAIAYGLARLRQKVALIDEHDAAIRAARGNFGLIWLQSKGDGCPDYAAWTRRSTDLWQDEFNAEIEDLTGVKTGYFRSGGLHFCLDGDEFEQRRQFMKRMAGQSGDAFEFEMWGRDTCLSRIPELGRQVAGASYSPQDGHVNPLYLLRAMHAGFNQKGGERYLGTVSSVQSRSAGFEISIPGAATIGCEKIVLAAGLGNRALGPQLGFEAPVAPQRGQILVTEKLRPFLEFPSLQVRQTVEGSIMIGVSNEDVGMNDSTDARVLGRIADRARRLFPVLEKARVVRAWGALRIMTPDGFPIYDQSTQYPGAFAASAHSGVTLAAVHALEFARYIIDGQLPASLASLSERRFRVH